MPKLCFSRALGRGAFLVADDADRFAAETAEAAEDGVVVAELAVAGESLEIGDQRVDVIDGMRPLRMPRDLRLLPGRQVGVEVFQRLCRLGLDAADLLGHRAGLAFRLHGAQLVDLGVELGNCFFKIEITAHEAKNRAGSRGCAR